MTKVSAARISKNYHKTMPVLSSVSDAISEAQIAVLVDTFYARVRQDEILGPVFERMVGDAWEPHLEKMRAFWSSLTLASGRYKGNPMMAHMMLTPRIGAEHFERWLKLWRQTAAEMFPELAAATFVGKAETMAQRLLATLDQYHDHMASRLADPAKRKIDGTGDGRLRIDN
jgi:hemoglobin